MCLHYICSTNKNYYEKLLTFLSIITLSVAVTSCGGKETKQNIEAPAGMVALDLSKFGKQFSIFVPDTTALKLEIVEQSWGALEIKVGKGFQLSITEDPGDIELRKSDIKSNDVNMFKSFVIEEPLTIMWESAITKPEYHFYSIQKVGNNTYVFEDIVSADGEPLGKDVVQKMLDSAKKIIRNKNLMLNEDRPKKIPNCNYSWGFFLIDILS